jgi:hypothetical protein
MHKNLGVLIKVFYNEEIIVAGAVMSKGVDTLK